MSSTLLLMISGFGVLGIVVLVIKIASDVSLKADLVSWRMSYGDRVPTRAELRQHIAARNARWRDEDRRREEIEEADFQYAKKQMKHASQNDLSERRRPGRS